MKLKYLLSMGISLLVTSVFAQNINIKTGWQLLGTNEDLNVSKFDNSCVDFIWKYDNTNSSAPWQLHVSNGQTYSLASNYLAISSLVKGSGIWLQGNDDCNLTISLSDGSTTTTINNTLWRDEEPDGYFTFTSAKSYCEDIGYRLPTGDELVEVWNYYGATISPEGFKKDTFYWGEDTNGSVLACPMDYDCSSPWTDMSLTGNGHPKCVIE